MFALALGAWGVLLVVSGPAHGFGHGVGVPAAGGTCESVCLPWRFAPGEWCCLCLGLPMASVMMWVFRLLALHLSLYVCTGPSLCCRLAAMFSSCT